jgi:hypothetical protein
MTTTLHTQADDVANPADDCDANTCFFCTSPETD